MWTVSERIEGHSRGHKGKVGEGNEQARASDAETLPPLHTLRAAQTHP